MEREGGAAYVDALGRREAERLRAEKEEREAGDDGERRAQKEVSEI